MKKILLLTIGLFTQTFLIAQDLDYSNYYKTFYDEFDYPFPVGTTGTVLNVATAGANHTPLDILLGTTVDGMPFKTYWITDDGYRNSGNAVSATGQVSLSSDLTCLNYLSITEDFRPDSSSDGHSRLTGDLTSVLNLNIDYGIVEARVRFPHGSLSTSDYDAASPVFWFYTPTKTEIDVFDGGFFVDYLPLRVWDWYYVGSLSGSPYNVSYTVNSTQLTGSPWLLPNLSGWHTYSVNWTPTDVLFYLDSFLLADIFFDYVRTYPVNPNYYLLRFYMQASSVSLPGQHMDIDWVKVWKQKCDVGPAINLSDVAVSGVIPPGMYKKEGITSSSSLIVSTDFLYPTILEAPSTTISSNFIADESVSYTGPESIPASPYSGSSLSYGPVSYNGFLIILPTNCDADASGTGYRNVTNGNNELNGVSYLEGHNVKAADQFSSGTGNITQQPYILGSNTQIQVYPNPTQDNINISYPCTSNRQLEISIKDVSGRSRYLQSVDCGEGSHAQYTVDISSFEKGVYFIELTLNSQHVVKKIVKL